MKILIIDNTMDRDSWGSSDLCALTQKAAKDAVTVVRRAPHEDLPKSPRGYDRIVLSGSRMSAMEDAPWTSKLHEFIRDSLRERIPMLGVCYGHQVIVRVLGSSKLMRRAEEAEYGWTKIEVLDSSSLLKDFPREFHSFSAHFEEVSDLPGGMKRLARSEACGIQACELEGHPVFGIQFHPERGLAAAEKSFSERRKNGTPKKLLRPKDGKKLYDKKIGEILNKNFMGIS